MDHQITMLLDRAQHFTYGDGADPAVGQALATEAVGRALLEPVQAVGEIGEQLDTIVHRGKL